MTKIRLRLSGFHYFWIGSVVISFIFGLLDKQCSITFDKFDEETTQTYQRRLPSPLTLFAPLQSSHNEMIRQVLSQTNDVSVGGTGFMVTNQYMFRKAMGWFTSEKESARLAEAGCSQIVIEDVIQESLTGSAARPDERPKAVAGECYHFPVYREWARVYNNVIAEGGHKEDSNENFQIGNTNRHLRLATIRSNLENNFQNELRKMRSLDDHIKVVLLFQNPRQWTLEVVNDRYELPTSEEYLHVLKEWVIYAKNLLTACKSLNAEFPSMCSVGRIEDVTGQPAETFGLESLLPQQARQHQNLYDVPIVDKEVDEVLAPVQSQIRKLGYEGWKTNEKVHKIDLFTS